MQLNKGYERNNYYYLLKTNNLILNFENLKNRIKDINLHFFFSSMRKRDLIFGVRDQILTAV